MINKVSNDIRINQLDNNIYNSIPIAHSESSSLTSLTSCGFLSCIWQFLLYILHCCPSKPAKKGVNGSINPDHLPDQDPFKNQLFVQKEGQWIFRHPKADQLIKEIFENGLGKGNPLNWLSNHASIHTSEKELSKLPLHPLEFLCLLLSNSTRIQAIDHFRSQSTSRLWQFVFHRAGRDPWNEFLNNQINNFKQNEKNLISMIPGFCKLLDLNEKQLQNFSSKAQYKELILFVLDSKTNSIK